MESIMTLVPGMKYAFTTSIYGVVGSVLFTLITLPVEFNASSRAIQTMENTGMGEAEINGSKKVLRAAAMTYVAALAVSLAYLFRLFLLVNRRNNRR